MNLSSSIDYTLLQNKFLNLVGGLWFCDFGRSLDQEEFGGSGVHGEFDNLGAIIFRLLHSLSTTAVSGVREITSNWLASPFCD